MAIHELYWIPPTAIGCWGWAWLRCNWAAVKPIRLPAVIGIVGLTIATTAFLSLFAAVLYSWINGRFDWLTPFDAWGVLLSISGLLIGVLATGRLRLFTMASALLSLVAWIGFVAARRVPLLF